MISVVVLSVLFSIIVQNGVSSSTPDVSVLGLQNTIWLIGANDTILKCNWYGKSGAIPILTEAERQRLAQLEVQVSTGKSSRNAGAEPPKYLVCDMSVGGVAVGSTGYPFMLMGNDEFRQAFQSDKYIPYPCQDSSKFLDKLWAWGDNVHRVASSVWITNLENQMFEDNRITYYVIGVTAGAGVIIILLIGLVIKKILVKRKSTGKEIFNSYEMGNLYQPNPPRVPISNHPLVRGGRKGPLPPDDHVYTLADDSE